MAFLNCVVVVEPVMVRKSVPFCKTRPVPERPATVTPMATVPVLQVIWTLVTLADAVPLPPETVQVCVGLEGGVETATLKVPPLATAVLKVKAPLPLTVRLSPPLFCSTIPVPVMPVTVPPFVKGPVPPPPPPPPGLPPPELGRPLHAARRRAAVIENAKRNLFVAGFMANDFSLVPSRCGIVTGVAIQALGISCQAIAELWSQMKV